MYGLKLKFAIENLLSDGKARTVREIVEDLSIKDKGALTRVRCAANTLAKMERIEKKQFKTRLKTLLNIYEKTNDQSSISDAGRPRGLEETN